MRQTARRDLFEKLAGVRHPILPKRDTTRACPRHRPQTIVRIGEAKARHDPSKPDRRLQQDPPVKRHSARTAQESAAERVGRVVLE